MFSASPIRRVFTRFLTILLQKKQPSSRRKLTLSRAAWIHCERLEERVMLSGAPLLRDFTVMSQNLYLGTDLTPIIAALDTGDPNNFIPAVSAGWQQVVESNFEERAGALADKILESQPTIIGLQEVALWQTGEAFHPAPATNVAFDFLEIVLDELGERGLHYTTVAVANNFSAEVPGFTGAMLEDIRLTDRDVILARGDLKTADLKLSNAQAENFETNLFFPLPPELGGGVELTRGWTSVDAKIRGKEFRIINTHLELELPPVGSLIQVAQAQELLAGPANTDLPVILLGDFNSRADQNGEVYELMTSSGFADMWTQTHPGEDGWTCCHDADLRNETVNFQEGRIDWILYRGDFLPLEMDLIGEELGDRTASGIWPSDHAGLVASLIVSPLPPVARRLSEPPLALPSVLASTMTTTGRLDDSHTISARGGSQNTWKGKGSSKTADRLEEQREKVFEQIPHEDLLSLSALSDKFPGDGAMSENLRYLRAT